MISTVITCYNKSAPPVHGVCRRKAFTLIELLVVIGLIAVLAGGIGLAFSGGDKANALQGAQGTLQSLASAVRGQAALSGGDAALFVNFDEDANYDTNKYLRSFVIARQLQDNSWELVGDEIALPAGIYLVPRSTGGLTKVEVGGGIPLSTAFEQSSVPINYPGGGAIPTSYAMVFKLTSRGSKAPNILATGSDIVLAPATIVPDGSVLEVVFADGAPVRGASISNYGVLTPINDATGF